MADKFELDLGDSVVEFDHEPTDQEISSVLSEIKSSSLPPQPKTSFMSKASDLLSLPERKSREGLGMISNLIPSFEPTGNTARDILLNTPKIAAETLKETAPSFVSPASILTQGMMSGGKAALPIIKPAAKFIGKTAEEISGLRYKNPDILTKAFEEPSLIFGKGLEKAREEYAKVSGVDPKIREKFKLMLDKMDFIKEALRAGKKGTLTADEALEARKTLDSVKKNVSGTAFRAYRDKFDVIAKTKFAEVDKIFARAIKSEALRTLAPINKGGSPSIFKVGVAGATIPSVLPLTSPLVQGILASGLGAGYKIVKKLGSSAKAIPAIKGVLDKSREKDLLDQ